MVRISRAFKTVGHKLELLQAYQESISKEEQIQDAVFDAYNEYISFAVNTLRFLREKEAVGERHSKELILIRL